MEFNTFGLDFGLIATIGGIVYVLTEAAKKKLKLVGFGTQLFAGLITAMFAYIQLQPGTGLEWSLALATAFIAWLAPDGLHQFFKKKNVM